MVDTFFTEKRIIKKIIIAIIFVFMFNFTFSYLGSNIVFAKNGEVMSDDEIVNEEGAGKLLLPIHSLLLFLADAALELMQKSFISDQPVTITARADSEKEVNGAAIAGIVIGVVVLAVACVVTYGAAAGIVGAVGTATAGVTGAAATAGAAAVGIATGVATYGGVLVGGLFFAGAAVAGIVYSGDKFIDDIKGEFELPTIQYTPEEIFANRIPMFDINFFNPRQDREVEKIRKQWNDEKFNAYSNYQLAIGMTSFLKYIKDEEKLDEFIDAGFETVIVSDMHGPGAIPGTMSHLIKSYIYEVGHNSWASYGYGVYVNNNKIMENIESFITYFCPENENGNHIAASHFFLGIEGENQYVYRAKFIDAANNYCTLYKYKLSNDEIEKYFSLTNEDFDQNKLLIDRLMYFLKDLNSSDFEYTGKYRKKTCNGGNSG